MPPTRPSANARTRARASLRGRGLIRPRREGVSRASQVVSGLVGLLCLSTALLFVYLVVGEGYDRLARDYQNVDLMESPSLQEAEERRARRPPPPYPLEPSLQGRIVSRLQRLLQGRIP